MWEFIEDRVGFDVDLVIANAQAGLGSSFKSVSKAASAPRPLAGLADRAELLALGAADLLGAGEPGEAPLGERLLGSEIPDRLLGLDRPIRVASQIWTNEVAEALELLSDRGVGLDPVTTPTVLGSAIRYWNTKVGGAELLARIDGLDGHLPPSTVVMGLAEGLALASSLPGPSVLKANAGVGGFGMLRLEPDEDLTVPELERRLAATATVKKKTGGGPAELGAPLVLQQLVGGEEAVSPSADYWIDRDGAACVALAEQVLDGYAYRGARFPGRLQPSSAARCVALGAGVAEALRERGYRGLLNVDFLVDGERIWLIEINVRQSAPLDQSLRMTRRHGADWRERAGFSYLEAEDEFVEL